LKKVAVVAIAFALLMTAGAIAPVLAVGPFNAIAKNPNVTPSGSMAFPIALLETPSGVSNRWTNDSKVTPTASAYWRRDKIMYLPASPADAEGPTRNCAVALTEYPADVAILSQIASSSASALEYENEWIFMSVDFLDPYLTGWLGEDEAGRLLDLWPYGVYYKYIIEGQLIPD